MNIRSCKLLLLLAGVMMTFGACKTVGISVPRLVPARKGNLGKFKTVGVQEFEGRAPGSAGFASEMSDATRQALTNYKGIKVLDRARLGQVLQELQMSASDLTDPSSTRKLGKMLTAGAIVAGKLTTHSYEENMEQNRSTCSRSVGKGKNRRTVQYACTRYKRTGKAVVRASMDVIDVTTGSTAISDALSAERSDYETATDQQPKSIDGNAMLAQARHQIVAEFIKDVLPHTVMVEVSFRKDGDLPALERGISYAKIGDWTNAVSTFREAIKSASGNANIDSKVLAYAYANLGLALACMGGKTEFEEATTHLNKAFQLSNDEDYLADKQMVDGWSAQQRKLEDQMSQEKEPSGE